MNKVLAATINQMTPHVSANIEWSWFRMGYYHVACTFIMVMPAPLFPLLSMLPPYLVSYDGYTYSIKPWEVDKTFRNRGSSGDTGINWGRIYLTLTSTVRIPDIHDSVAAALSSVGLELHNIIQEYDRYSGAAKGFFRVAFNPLENFDQYRLPRLLNINTPFGTFTLRLSTEFCDFHHIHGFSPGDIQPCYKIISRSPSYPLHAICNCSRKKFTSKPSNKRKAQTMESRQTKFLAEQRKI
jgi:hypothetical protein